MCFVLDSREILSLYKLGVFVVYFLGFVMGNWNLMRELEDIVVCCIEVIWVILFWSVSWSL